jgi:hypothetical protein
MTQLLEKYSVLSQVIKYLPFLSYWLHSDLYLKQCDARIIEYHFKLNSTTYICIKDTSTMVVMCELLQFLKWSPVVCNYHTMRHFVLKQWCNRAFIVSWHADNGQLCRTADMWFYFHENVRFS